MYLRHISIPCEGGGVEQYPILTPGCGNTILTAPIRLGKEDLFWAKDMDDKGIEKLFR